MRSFVIGTAGHVDHGKSTLVKALTGTDPDRLEEEKQRGITIELGFAHLDLGPDLKAAIIDVPGHERFIKNMVAGTGGIDLLMLVVAADEGVMPQTREHLDIAELLGVRAGLVVLSKADLSENPDWLKMVQEDLREELRGTFLESGPIVSVSALTGQGLSELRNALAEAGNSVPSRPADGLAFLPIDRVFSLHGFGTVATGTLFSGRLRTGDLIDAVPDAAVRLRGLSIRGLQSHGEPESEVLAGQRVAVNLSGVEKIQLARGQVLVHHGSLRIGREFEAQLRLLPGAKPLKTRTELLLHTGTAHAETTIQLVGCKVLEPGATGFARMRLSEPMPLLPGQRFIVRGGSPIAGRGTTLAGGEIVAVLPPRRRERDLAAWRAELEVLASGAAPERIEVVLARERAAGQSLGGLLQQTGLGQRVLERELARLLSERRVFKFDREHERYVAASEVRSLSARAVEVLGKFHAENRLLPGMPTEQLRTSLADDLDPKLFRVILSELGRAKEAVEEGDRTRLAAHRVSLDSASTARSDAILALYRGAGLAPPRLSEVAAAVDLAADRVREMVGHLARTGALRHLSADLWIETGALAELEQRLRTFLCEHESIDTQAFKQLVGGSRKHVIPLAEYFDREKVTLRVGDKRVLRKRN